MNLHSIRWRLPLSYAVIALLAALALGSVMLMVLGNYYAGQERAYLTDNALALRPIVENFLQRGMPGQALQDQIAGMGFFSQVQIRVLDPSGRVLADSGVPDTAKVIGVSGAPAGVVVFSVPVATTVDGTPSNAFFSKAVSPSQSQAIPFEPTPPAGATTDSVIAVSASPLGGYGFVSSVEMASDRRSSQVVSQPLAGGLGTLEISHGPAYGADILDSVSLAWLMASVIAVVLAALAGWFASRQVTRPVLALTDATRRMEQGDLSARVELPDATQLEFSALARSFNGMAGRVEDTISTLRAFVSDAAHELNTPLTALRTNLELAANEPDAARKEIFLTRALEQNQRLERLTAGLLDLSRIETAGSGLDSAAFDLRRLIAETGERFASRADQAERTFDLVLPENDIPLQGNPQQIQRAVDNLLENALKFTPAGGSIALKLEQLGSSAVLTVSDTGIGIPLDDLPHLFERFHRGRNSAAYPGNGLGLAIVKAIVETHGGHVEAARRERGSEFSILLPLAQNGA